MITAGRGIKRLKLIFLATKVFVTKFFYPEGGDDIIGYMKSEDVVKLANQVLGKGFQVS